MPAFGFFIRLLKVIESIVQYEFMIGVPIIADAITRYLGNDPAYARSLLKQTEILH